MRYFALSRISNFYLLQNYKYFPPSLLPSPLLAYVCLLALSALILNATPCELWQDCLCDGQLADGACTSHRGKRSLVDHTEHTHRMALQILQDIVSPVNYQVSNLEGFLRYKEKLHKSVLNFPFFVLQNVF